MYEEEAKKKVNIDERLFERISMGDEEAFKELYELSYKPLYAFLLSLTQNAEDAQDLLQDTFVQVFNHSHKYQNKGNPMAWMMKIGKNLFLMQYRKNQNKQTASFEELENMLGLDQIQNVEDRILLEKIFSEVSSEEREIIVMHVVGGLKFREIAQVTGKPVGTVLARYNRSMKKLQKDYQVNDRE